MAALLLTFIVLLPKGGIRMADIPLTTGYAILFFLAGLSFTWYTFSGRIRWIGKYQAICLGCFIPFFALSTFKILASGYLSLGFMISFYVSLFFIPVTFLLLFYHPLKHISFEFIKSLLVKFIFLTAIYGIFLFFYKLYTGEFIEIPLVTVNMGDVGELENKHINRGGIFKLISTYNNGNLYGICMLMLLPLYQQFEKKTHKKGIVKLALLLTLSRTVWIGLIMFEFLNFVFIKRKTIKSYIGIGMALVIVFIAISIGLSLLNKNIYFLADSSLGGRADQVEVLNESTFFPDLSTPFQYIREMVYFSVIENFGWIGLPLFFLYLSTPILLYMLRQVPQPRFIVKKCLVLGLVLYHFVAIADGAILYIPIMAIYWLVVSLLLSNLNLPSSKEKPACTYV